ncbi:MAG: hypothetical protein AAGE86_06990 [Pseudomonadota bacterium]
MTEQKPSNLPLILMIVWYVFALLGTGLLLLVGVMFGSEVYRNEPMPLVEWVTIAGPFVLNVVFLIATILLWINGKRQAAFAIVGLSCVGFLGFLVLGGAIGI